jgi:hypothetical protein
VLVLDDAQWADLDSLRFISYLQRRLEGLAVGVIVAARVGEGGAAEKLVAGLGTGGGARLVARAPAPLGEGGAARTRARNAPPAASHFLAEAGLLAAPTALAPAGR